MAIEIEKKYLLKSKDILQVLKNEGLEFKKEHITQIYTKITDTKETRVRKCDNEYFLTSKIGKGLKRKELERKIDVKLFEFAEQNRIGQSIQKIRHTFKLQNKAANIDIYELQLDGLIVLEVEFEDEQTANTYVLPNIFQEQVIKDVTTDEAYKNKNLALYGCQNQIDMGELFDSIKREPFEQEFLKRLPINSYDGMRSIYYSLYGRIDFFKDIYLQNQNNEALHQFRVNIRKTRSLLQSLSGVFDTKINTRFIQDFKLIANATNSQRDIDVFKEYLNELDELEAEGVLELLDKNETACENDILAMFKGEEYAKNMQEWLVVLQDEDRFFEGEKANCPIKTVAAKTLLKRLKKIKTKLENLQEDTELEKFHTARIEFKRLRYLAEFFNELLGLLSLEKTIKLSKKMQTLFGTLQDRDTADKILTKLENDERFSSDVLAIHSIETIKELLIDDVYSLKCDILTNKKSLFDTLNECLKDLKIYI